MAPRSDRPQEFCPWCGQPLRPVLVHGEIRCGSCRMPVSVCCEGAPLREHEVPACPIPGPPAAGSTGETGRPEGSGEGAGQGRTTGAEAGEEEEAPGDRFANTSGRPRR